jgi:hypothetical protein
MNLPTASGRGIIIDGCFFCRKQRGTDLIKILKNPRRGKKSRSDFHLSKRLSTFSLNLL